MTPIVGIIGGIGSGKTLVANAMQRVGGYLIVADRLGHDALVQPHIKEQLVERWGNSVLDAQGNPDRRAIARIVFNDPVELRTLESFVFPFIEQRIAEEIAHARARRDIPFIILDAAIMLETGWHAHCDKILFVDTPREQRLRRLRETRGWDEDEVVRREAMQMPLEEKRVRADAVIVNDAHPEKIAPQVQDALERWKFI